MSFFCTKNCTCARVFLLNVKRIDCTNDSERLKYSDTLKTTAGVKENPIVRDRQALQESYACMKTVSVHLTFPNDCRSSIVDSFSDRMDTAQCKDCRYKYVCLFSDLSSNDFNSHSLTDGSHIRPYRCVTRTRQSHHTPFISSTEISHNRKKKFSIISNRE
ncbi:unnamed protein product [Albugo candida]|uniref:Uncharacterized protein n=1 Tax=Albugo candida TaxID=65357 RepID=A0A024FTS6_9STRA|nr:unnamed protein product [Albugo candida]|eukprot:CCI10533.1 unnamed protein product [Albugo candida]